MALFLFGCSAPHRTLTLAPTLPACVPSGVNTVRVTAQGDFPPEATLTAAASPSAPATVALPRATRAVVVEGFGPTGLAAFGRTATLSLDALPSGPLPIAYGAPDSICATADMHVARAGHHATLLGSGAVLITGGDPQNELYDPATATFRLGDLLRPDQVDGHAATALADGGALVTGGLSPDGIASPAATRFDDAGRQVGPSRLLLEARARHSATRLPDGRVLLAGGCRDLRNGVCDPIASTELYDPASDTSTAGPPLLRARAGHDAILRGDGTVLLVGGTGDGGADVPIEVVDPDESRGFDAGVASGAAVALATGSALVVGGPTAPGNHAVWLWSSPSEAPLMRSSLGDARAMPSLTPLDDGSVLVAGGGSGALTLVDGRGGVADVPAPARFSANEVAATRLADGTVLLTGGDDGSGATARAALFFHSPLSPWASLPPLTLDGSADPYLPRRPDRAATDGGQLVVTAPSPSADGRPAELALVAGMQVADFTFDVLAGRRGAAGAALVVAWQSEAAYDFIVVEPGRAVELWAVSSPRTGQTVAAPVAGCQGASLPDGALPDGALAPIEVAWRAGSLSVTTGGATLLRCRPPALPRGATGVAALHGTAVFDDLALAR